MTIIEVVTALALVGLVAASVAVLTERTTAAVVDADGRDGARQVAIAMIESAAIRGCGLARGDEGSSTADLIKGRCWGSVGDSTWSTTVGSISYVATLTTMWRQIGAGRNCSDTTRPAALRADADGLALTVSVVWTEGGRPQQVTIDDYETVPPDAAAYRDTSRGALVLSGAEGVSASVSSNGKVTVQRKIGPGGCSLFPFLPQGTAQWSVGAQSGTSFISPQAISTAP